MCRALIHHVLLLDMNGNISGAMLCLFCLFNCLVLHLTNTFLRQVQQSRPASACLFPTPRLNLVLTHGVPSTFRGGVYFGYIRSRNCVPIAFTVESPPAQGTRSNGCCLYRFHEYAPLFSHINDSFVM